MKNFYFIHYNHIIKLISEGKNYKGETHDQFLRIISYLEKQLELFSNLCFGRNFLNKKIMREKLKSAVLLEYIWNRELPAELRAAFVSLLLQTHIDSISKNERIVPMFTKKFIGNPTKQTKKRNQTNLFNSPSPKNNNKLHEIPLHQDVIGRPSKSSKFQAAVVDVTIVNALAKTLQSKSKNQQNKFENEHEENSHSSSRPFQFPQQMDESSYKVELISEFFNEEKSITDDQIKGLKDKIIEFLEKEIYKKPKNIQKNVTIFKKNLNEPRISRDEIKDNINFDLLLLNIVILVRKMVVCECFAFQDKKPEATSPQKNILQFFGKPKLQHTQNEFQRLLKNLIIILENQSKPMKIKRLETTKTKNNAGFVTNIFGKINNTIQDATETMKNVATNLGQIFFKDAGLKSKTNKKKKRASFIKLDSVSNFFIAGINFKKKFLKNLTQNDYKNYDVNFFIFLLFLNLNRFWLKMKF